MLILEKKLSVKIDNDAIYENLKLYEMLSSYSTIDDSAASCDIFADDISYDKFLGLQYTCEKHLNDHDFWKEIECDK